MHYVFLKNQAKKDLDKLDKCHRDKVSDLLLVLQYKPYLGKKLNGELQDSYSLRVWPYRILYQIFSNISVIYILRIQHRQNAYK
jgi:addiction module RelE/StbE family toxin